MIIQYFLRCIGRSDIVPVLIIANEQPILEQCQLELNIYHMIIQYFLRCIGRSDIIPILINNQYWNNVSSNFRMLYMSSVGNEIYDNPAAGLS